jgi:hypothetical protein
MIVAICEYLDIRLFETLDDFEKMKYVALRRGDEYKLDPPKDSKRNEDLILDEDNE